MRKVVSLILLTLMLLSLPVFVSGEEAALSGAPVASASDFAAMTADGSYYLSADIAISSPYSGVFTGTLDGNGHTVTVSNCSMFDIVDGATVKNLKILGNIALTNESAAALAVRAVSGFTVVNVTSEVNISVTGARQGLYAAGLLATTDILPEDNEMYYEGRQPASVYTARCTFIGCKNTGDISITLEGIPEVDPDSSKTGNYALNQTTAKPRAGGICAVGQDFVCVDCENSGDIIASGVTSSICGGIVARAGNYGGQHTNYFICCKNSGSVTSGTYAGGISGYSGAKGGMGICQVYGCSNSGTITGPSHCGGLVGYMYAGKNQYIDIEYCVNTGKLIYARPNKSDGTEQTSYVSGWVAYTNSVQTILRYNIDYVDRQIADGGIEWSNAVVCVSSADPLSYTMEFNYLVDPDGYVRDLSGTNKEYKDQNTNPISEAGDRVYVLRDDSRIVSGEVAYTCNLESEGVNAWFSESDPAEVNRVIEYYQKLGTDSVPDTEIRENCYVLFNGSAYYNGNKTESQVTAPEQTSEDQTSSGTEEITTEDKVGETTSLSTPVADDTTAAEPVETTRPSEPVKKGCGSFVAAGAAVVAVLGAAFVAKKKF